MQKTALDEAKEKLHAARLQLQGWRVPHSWPCRPAPQILQLDELVWEVDAYREAGATAMRALWALFRQWEAVELEAVSQVRVLVCTADVAMKALSGGALYPASKLLKHSACKGLWADEAQRLPGPTVVALAASVPSLGLSGDSGQRVITGGAAEVHFETGITGQIADQLTCWADQLLLRPATDPEESSGAAALAERFAPGSSALWKLPCCKRIGDPALSFIRG